LCSVEDVVRVYIHDLHIVVSDSETQRRGAVGILDFKNVGIRKMKDVTPSLLKKLADIVQGTFPVKVKAFIFVNHSWIVRTMITMVWPFLSDKMRNRISLHDSFASLHEMIDPACLPSDYDGHLGPISEMSTVEEVVKPAANMFECLNKC